MNSSDALSPQAVRKIDCHCHLFDPARFPYRPDTRYAPQGQETGTAEQWAAVMDAHGVRHALLVGPTSGYATDNRCMLDALERYPVRFRGVAVVEPDIDRAALGALQRAGVVGIAFNPAADGLDAMRDVEPLFDRLAELDMFAQIQTDADQLCALIPLIERTRTRVLIDHGGRPDAARGLDQPGFAALLRLADTGRTIVKLSGMQKFSAQGFPFADAMPYVRALLERFGAEHCVWASDWPFLRAPHRMDYGPLIDWFARCVPQHDVRARIWWDTPMRLFKFAEDGKSAASSVAS
ncbi:MAG TPA: amidohydrolase family protein [Paraburkholderia sp.]